MRYRDPGGGVYKRLWIRGNRVQGAILYGDTRSAAWYAELIENQRDVSELRHTLLLDDAPLASAAS
jgi:nitrite reductase (NADH) large subunit